VASALSEGREGGGGSGNKLSMEDLRFLFLGAPSSSNRAANGSGNAGAGVGAKNNGQPAGPVPANGTASGSTAVGAVQS
jgi:hypothetical protein